MILNVNKLDELVVEYGKITTAIEKDIKMLNSAEGAFGKGSKEVKKMLLALKTVSSFYIKKQEIVALEAEQIKGIE